MTLGSIGVSFSGVILSLGLLSDKVNLSLKITVAVLGGVMTGFQLLKNHATQTVADSRGCLREILNDSGVASHQHPWG